MNACLRYEPMLDLLLDGLLTPSEEKEIRAHLDVCPSCAARLRELTELKAALAALDTEAPAELHGRIMTAVTAAHMEEKKKKPLLARLTNRRTLSAVAACAVLALGVVVWRALPSGSKEAAADTAEPEAFMMATETPTAAPDVRSEAVSGAAPAAGSAMQEPEDAGTVNANEVDLPLGISSDAVSPEEPAVDVAADADGCAAARCFTGDLEGLREALPGFDCAFCAESDGVLELSFLTGSAGEEQFLAYLTEQGWTEQFPKAEELPALDMTSPYTRYILRAQ